MQTTSTRFLQMLREPHLVSIRATIIQPNQAPVVVPITGGQVTVDGSALVRRQGVVTMPWSLDQSVSETAGIDVRTLPFGSYMLLERGVRYSDGSTEVVKVGRLRIESASWKQTEDVASLELADRWAQLEDQRLTAYTPTVVPSQAAYDLVYRVFGTTINYYVTAPAGQAALVDVVYTDTLGQAVADLADAVDCEAFFDPNGDFVFRDIVTDPDPRGLEDWTVDAGPGGVFIDADESLDRTETYSSVLVRGQNSAGQPVFGVARDTDPASPTYYLGAYGEVKLVYDSTAVQSQAKADKSAARLLAQSKGLSRSLAVATIPNPALDVRDTVRLKFPDGRDEQHLLTAFTIPMDATSAMPMSTFTKYLPGAAAAGTAGAAAAALVEEALT